MTASASVKITFSPHCRRYACRWGGRPHRVDICSCLRIRRLSQFRRPCPCSSVSNAL